MTHESFWSSRKYHLDKMTVRELLVVFYQYPAVVAYHALLVASVVGFFFVEQPRPVITLLWIAIGWANFSLSWYLLHRWLLQSTILWRFKLTAGLWKRIHYDHHQDPNDLRVLFGALHTTLPPMLLLSAGAWALGAGAGGALAFLATSLGLTIWNEFCHCIQHLKVDPGFAYLRRIKKLHLIHHFKSERVYYGITNFFWDKMFGTYPDNPAEVQPSGTVNNLGYDDATAARYPWVREQTLRAELSATGGPTASPQVG